MTLAALAKAAGVDAKRLRSYEAGVSSAPASVVVRLARALGLSAAALFDDSGGWSEALTDLASAGVEGSLDLARAFAALPDERMRRAFLNLAWTIVESQNQAGEGSNGR